MLLTFCRKSPFLVFLLTASCSLSLSPVLPAFCPFFFFFVKRISLKWIILVHFTICQCLSFSQVLSFFRLLRKPPTDIPGERKLSGRRQTHRQRRQASGTTLLRQSYHPWQLGFVLSRCVSLTRTSAVFIVQVLRDSLSCWLTILLLKPALVRACVKGLVVWNFSLMIG